jgi:L-alanine-DL-glutamate epimerase-like enolase superfamily enzyme
MHLNRREWMKSAGIALFAGLLPGGRTAGKNGHRSVPDYEQPLFDLPARIADAQVIESIELLARDGHTFVRMRSAQGVVGISPTKQIAHFIPIFRDLVAPHFIGRDARELERLVDDVYRANYKLAGQALWCPVAYLDQCILDLLGRAAGLPAGELMGGVIRRTIPVYLSGSGRDTSAEEEVAVYEAGVAQTGARAVKFKIGGRMSRNRDVYPGRTETLIRQARKKLGDGIVLYADANGSYDAATAIGIGRELTELGYGFFEEPCPWEEYSETLQVARALDIPIAAGEQDSSLWRFNWMMEQGMPDIVQPDLNYNGGFVRAARVARMARAFGLPIVPHNTQTGPASVHMLQFASSIPNIGAFMEYPWRKPQEPETWYSPNFIVRDGALDVPTGPGLGLEIDPAFLAGAELLVKIGS